MRISVFHLHGAESFLESAYSLWEVSVVGIAPGYKQRLSFHEAASMPLVVPLLYASWRLSHVGSCLALFVRAACTERRCSACGMSWHP